MARVAVGELNQIDDYEFSILNAYHLRDQASSSVTHLGCSYCVTVPCSTAPAWLHDQAEMRDSVPNSVSVHASDLKGLDKALQMDMQDTGRV